jgi:hypothetical protein
MPAEKKPTTVPVGSLRLDSEVYRQVTQAAYSQQMPVEQMINQMLRKQLVSQELFRHGFTITHKETMKTLTGMLSDELIVEAAGSMKSALREMVVSRTGSVNPTVQQYFASLASLMDLNGYPTSIQTDPEDGTVTVNVRPNISRKFSLFLGESIRVSLEGMAQVADVDATDSSVHVRCTPKKADVAK